jgi:glycosyltransferase involved in cell wall biosynthesis
VATLVSVIVPTYNYARYLPECIASLSRQSHGHWECIIVDDGSTDETPTLCARLAQANNRIRVVRQKNRGLSAARNTGIRHAQGQVLQFLDADDLLEDNKLASQIAVLDRRPEVDVVVGPAAFFSGPSLAKTRPWVGEAPLHVLASDVLETRAFAVVFGNICVVHAALVRRPVVDTVGFFDETLQAHEDWDFWLRCALAGKRFLVHNGTGDRALVREHGQNMSSSRDKMIRTAILVRERLAMRLPPALQVLNAERMAEVKWRYGLELIRAGRAEEGWSLYRAGLWTSRRKIYALSRLLSLVPGLSLAARRARERGRRES